MVTETSTQPRRRIGCLKKRDGTAATLSDSENEESGLFSKSPLSFGLAGRVLLSDSEDDLPSAPTTSNPLTGNLLSGNGRLDTNFFKGKNPLGLGLDKSLLALTDSEQESDQDQPSSTSGSKYGKGGGISENAGDKQKSSKAARILEMLGYESEEEAEETTQRTEETHKQPVIEKPPTNKPIPKETNEVADSSSSSSEEENDQLAKIIKTPRKTTGGLKSATKRDLLEMHKETERLIRQSALAAPTRIPKVTQKRLDMSAFLKKFQKPNPENAGQELIETPEEDPSNMKPSVSTSEGSSTEQSASDNHVNVPVKEPPAKVKAPNSLTGFFIKPAQKSATAMDKGKQPERQIAPVTVDSPDVKPSVDQGKNIDESHSINTTLADPFISKQPDIVSLSHQASDSDSELEIIENPKDLAIQGLLKVVQKKPRNSPIKPVSHPNPTVFTSPSRVRTGNIVTHKQLNRKLLNTIQSQSAKRRINDIERQLAKQYAPDKVEPEILSDEEGILLSGEEEDEGEGEDENEDEDEGPLSENESKNSSEVEKITTSVDDEITNIMQQSDVEEENSNSTDDEMPLPSSLRPRHKASGIFNRVVSDDEGEIPCSVESTLPTLPTQSHHNQPSHQMDEEGFMLSSFPKSQDGCDDDDTPTQYITEDGLLTLNAPTQETILCTPSQDSIEATQIVNSSLASISQSPPHTWSRLQQNRSIESTKPMTEMDAFALLGQAARDEYHKTNEASMVTQLKPKNQIPSEFIDAEAEEEEDEFGVGIDDEEDEESDEDIMIPTLDEEEHFDHQDVKQLHLQQMKEKDRKEISNLMNDIATGGLRKRRRLGFDDGKGYDLDEEFSDEESLNRRSRFRLIKRRTGADDFLDRIAQNPETAAFARAVADSGKDVEDPFDHVVDNAEDVFSMFRSNHSVSVEEIYSREMSMEVEETDDTVEEVDENALHISEAKIYYNQTTTTTTKSVSFDFTKSDDDFSGRDQSILRLIKNRNSVAASVEDPNDESTYEPWMNTHRSGVSFLETNPDRAKRFVSMANEDKILGEVVARKEFNQKNMAFRSASKTKFTTKSISSSSKGKTPERPAITKLAKSCGSSAIESPTNSPSKVSQISRSEAVPDPCPLLKVLSRYDSFQ